MLLRVGCRQVLDQADGVDQRVVKTPASTARIQQASLWPDCHANVCVKL